MAALRLAPRFAGWFQSSADALTGHAGDRRIGIRLLPLPSADIASTTETILAGGRRTARTAAEQGAVVKYL